MQQIEQFDLSSPSILIIKMKKSDRLEFKNIGKVELSPAYQSVDLIDQEGHQVFSQEKGQKKLKEMVEGDAIMKPLYYQEVDHHIEEVGIMAIKQVKYVTEKQWERMIAMQKDQQEIWKYLESIAKYEKRSEISKKIPRNDKGRFVSNQGKKKQEKTQPIKKRGRPRKEKEQ